MSDFLAERGVLPHPGLPKGYLSFSQISKYLRCAMSYKFHYINNAPFVGSEALALGKAVHEAIEHAHKQQIAGETPVLETLLDVAKNAARDQVMQEPWGADSAHAVVGMQYAAEACVLAWWQKFGETCKPQCTEKEIIYLFEDHEGRPVPVLGYVDLIHTMDDGNLEVLDYKTTARAKTQTFVNESLQLWIYSIMTDCSSVGIASIVRPQGIIAHCTSGSAAKLDIKRTTVSDAQKLHARNIIKDVVAGVAAQYYPRCAPGEWNCTAKWCSYFEECRGSLQGFLVPQSVT